MATLFTLNTIQSGIGDLTMIENILPDEVKRVFYIRGSEGHQRGGHRHHATWQALISIAGTCRVYVDNNETQEYYLLDTCDKCLLLEPEDWHVMDMFEDTSILLVLANTKYDINDYIFTPYVKTDESKV